MIEKKNTSKRIVNKTNNKGLKVASVVLLSIVNIIIPYFPFVIFI
jgi:hypothetical protein